VNFIVKENLYINPLALVIMWLYEEL